MKTITLIHPFDMFELLFDASEEELRKGRQLTGDKIMVPVATYDENGNPIVQELDVFEVKGKLYAETTAVPPRTKRFNTALGVA